MASEMVERVARAIEPNTFDLPRIMLHKPDYDRVFSRARAAIAAMREPTDAMTAAGADLIEADDRMDAEALVRNAAAIYKAMIDAAITDNNT